MLLALTSGCGLLENSQSFGALGDAGSPREATRPSQDAVRSTGEASTDTGATKDARTFDATPPVDAPPVDGTPPNLIEHPGFGGKGCGVRYWSPSGSATLQPSSTVPVGAPPGMGSCEVCASAESILYYDLAAGPPSAEAGVDYQGSVQVRLEPVDGGPFDSGVGTTLTVEVGNCRDEQKYPLAVRDRWTSSGVAYGFACDGGGMPQPLQWQVELQPSGPACVLVYGPSLSVAVE